MNLMLRRKMPLQNEATARKARPSGRMRMGIACAAASLVLPLLSSCAGGTREPVHFAFNKPEAIPIMREMVADYNASQDKYQVNLDTSGVDATSASFVRGTPPDIALANYNYETARFIQRCTLSDLSDTPEASRINPDLDPLMNQYGSCEGRTSALPYSVMAAGVIYNKDIFAENGLKVPTTWDELIEVCETLKAAGITQFYGTFYDPWTVGQGWFDYTTGGMVDILDFYDMMWDLGSEVGPDSEVSFQKTFAEPMEKMSELLQYVNDDANSRAYTDGNLAFANGEAAMYLQGPWALGEITAHNEDIQIGTFPLPMTNDPQDLKIRVNTDLAVWIPEASTHQEAARDFLHYLYDPEVHRAYNESQRGITPTVDAALPSDPALEGVIPFYDNAQFYQGASVLIPKSIPVFNYAQSVALGADADELLSTLDADWARLARRQ